jgi:hypothetical protein
MSPLEIAGGGEKGRRAAERVSPRSPVYPGRHVSRVLFPGAEARGMVICLGRLSPTASSSLPAASRISRPGGAVWVTPRRLFGLAPTGGYRATAVTSDAVGSYPTVSPLPFPRARARVPGGLFSVALSVASRRPGVTWQSTRWSSDFPRALDRSKLQPEPATIRPACAP